jgi:hypothetical protein
MGITASVCGLGLRSRQHQAVAVGTKLSRGLPLSCCSACQPLHTCTALRCAVVACLSLIWPPAAARIHSRSAGARVGGAGGEVAGA